MIVGKIAWSWAVLAFAMAQTIYWTSPNRKSIGLGDLIKDWVLMPLYGTVFVIAKLILEKRAKKKISRAFVNGIFEDLFIALFPDGTQTTENEQEMKPIKQTLSMLFFWGKKKQTPIEKFKELMPVIVEYLPKLREMLSSESRIHLSDPAAAEPMSVGQMNLGQAVNKMYDFFQNYNGSVDGFVPVINAWGTFTVSSTSDIPRPIDSDRPPNTRVAVTPKSVAAELDSNPTPFSVEGIDEKIETLRKKSKMVSHHIYTKAQIDGMIKRLEYRKRYHEQASFYEAFPCTTDEKIDGLLSRYKLVIKKPDLFIPTMPKEAIDVMEQYTEVTKELTGEEPVFYLIAEEKDFKKKFEKLDPILLVQSPFAFTWQVLGAWDVEMLLLSEL